MHPDDPELVIKLRHSKTPADTLARMHRELVSLRWLKNAGFPAVEPVGLIRVAGTDNIGLVSPRLHNMVFPKDFIRGVDEVGMQRWQNVIASHGQKILDQLDGIRKLIDMNDVYIDDLQFAFAEDGTVLIIDPNEITLDSKEKFFLHLEKAYVGVKNDMRNIAEGRPVDGLVY